MEHKSGIEMEAFTGKTIQKVESIQFCVEGTDPDDGPVGPALLEPEA